MKIAFLGSIRRSVRRKLMLVVVATTIFALLLTGVALSIYAIRTYDASLLTDMETQAEILGRASEAALAFNDPKAAEENLRLLRVRPLIQAAALYAADGRLFASYAPGDENVPERAQPPGHRIEGDRLRLFHSIENDRSVIGTIYLSTRYELVSQLADYLVILAGVMAASLLIATLLSTWLQARFIKPILDVTDVAHQVMERRDFSLRAEHTTPDEIGYLVDTFNDMLAEIGQRAAALEQAYATLQHEMAERRGAEAALRAADRRKDEFLATLAHELRNPLAPLRNALSILRMPHADEALKTEVQELMERQLAQLVRLVDDLLDVSRITTGKLALRRERVELHAVVQNALDTVHPLIEARHHELSAELPQERVWLDADATRLAQILSNLLNNAAKYTPPGGRIRLCAVAEPPEVAITVSDNGIGIPPEMLTRIFEMFAQVETGLDRETAGLGVGLSLAKRLAELHGGSIAVASDGKGRGSCFTVRLPATFEHATAGALREGVAHDAAEGRKLSVLVADDNVDFATSLGILLRTLGHEVTLAHDGAEALAAAERHPPDVALLDIGLPKLHGYALARKLRDNPATRNARLVAITGWGQDQDRQRAKDAGFDRHLVKPVGFEQIAEVLQSVDATSGAAER